MSDLIKHEQNQFVSIFSDANSFEQGQRMASALAKSNIVPREYQGNIANCMVALDMANKMQIDPLTVLQNLDIIFGRPAWKSTFVISRIEQASKFEPGSVEFEEEKDRTRMVAKKRNGKTVHGSWISNQMAKDQGWWNRKDSKWPAMPEQMRMYRAASFFARVHCPEVLNGMRSADEMPDTVDVEYTEEKPSFAAEFNEKNEPQPKQNNEEENDEGPLI